MNITINTAVLSVSATLIVGAFTFMYRFLRDTVEDLAKLKSSLEKQIKDGDIKNNEAINSSINVTDHKLSEVYDTFNKYRESIEKNFVNKDVCDILHKTSSDNLNGIETRLTASFNKLEARVEKNFADFTQQIISLFKNGGSQQST
ncbi:MAG: hypothetical protein WC389_16745 [Lutibacter sp.]|jgi:hypothetical protein